MRVSVRFVDIATNTTNNQAFYCQICLVPTYEESRTMENAATDDTSGRDAGEHGHDCSGRTAKQDSVQSASAVTEVGSSGNAAAVEETRRPGLDDGRGEDYGRLTVVERKAVDDYYDPVEAEMMAVGRDVPSSPLRLAAARFGWLLLGFLAGAAAAVLFLIRLEPPTTCTVTVPT